MLSVMDVASSQLRVTATSAVCARTLTTADHARIVWSMNTPCSRLLKTVEPPTQWSPSSKKTSLAEKPMSSLGHEAEACAEDVDVAVVVAAAEWAVEASAR